MLNPKYYTLIKAPQLSEKSNRLGEMHNQYVFKVVKDATKPEIKQAVEALFKVKVADVNVLNQKGKIKNAMRRPGFRKGFKKAYITLQQGSSINFENLEL